MTLQIGEMVEDRYRVVKLLGQGGMGAVYRAWDVRLNVPVALKEMAPQPGLANDMLEDLRRQFQQEAQVLATLSHPSLVRVTDYFSWGGNSYLVMDFVDGQSLAQRIEEKGPQSEADVLRWARQLLDALTYCHERGVLHRDIKPQNIIITSDRAVLVDFGLVKLWDPHDPHTRTVLRGAGTPEYAPPEQYDMGLGHTDPRSDIYSLGATLYQALTAQAPPTATQRMANPASFVPPRRIRADISPATEAAILKAMAVPMDQRFRSAPEMARALFGEEGATRVITPRAPVSKPISAPAMPVTATGVPAAAAGTALPAQRKGGGRTLLWIGLAVLVLACISVPIILAALGLIAGGDGRDVVYVTATPTRVIPPTNTRPAVTPTQRPQPSPTTRPVGTLPQPGEMLFEDDFGDPASGWEVEQFDDGSVGYRDGRYFVISARQATAVWGQANRNLGDIIIEVDAIQVGAPANDNNGYGVMCRLQPNGDGYLLRISGDGFYSIHRVVNGEFQPLVDWARSPVINQGNNSNHISVICDGRLLALVVNGELLATAEDGAFATGDIALTATTFEAEATEVQFDNLVVFVAGRPAGRVLFADDFSDPASGWEVGNYVEGDVGYGDGYYFVISRRDGGAMWGNAFRNFGDVVIEVDATQVAGPVNNHNAYGVKCRVQGGGTGGDGYALIIGANGQYSIQVIRQGNYDMLVGWGTSMAINRGNATNHIRAVCVGTRLALFVNGELLAEVEDATYASGDISLMAATLEPEATEIHFDNLVVMEP